ncbi:MAG: hypothetical protein Q8R23_06535 [Methylotenera sp.]|nr:hypothetical protein [Methylotenera sp.]
MTLPIDAVAVGMAAAGSAAVGLVATGMAVVDLAVVGATVGLVAIDPVQAVSETKPAMLRRKMTFKIEFLMDASPLG